MSQNVLTYMFTSSQELRVKFTGVFSSGMSELVQAKIHNSEKLRDLNNSIQ